MLAHFDFLIFFVAVSIGTLARFDFLIFSVSPQPCGSDAPTIASPCEVNNMAMAMFQWLAKKWESGLKQKSKKREWVRVRTKGTAPRHQHVRERM